MILRSLKLENFRSYKNYQTDFKTVTIFVGPNGVGKTNLIEAVYCLSIGKSFRVHQDKEVIKWGSDYCKITGKTDLDDLEIFISQAPDQIKVIKIKGARKKVTELLGKMKAIIFSPESIDIVTGSPRPKRKFLDMVLSQTDPKYLLNLVRLQKVLKNRNRLLLGIKLGSSKDEELNFWDSELINLSVPIFEKRENFIKFVNSKINKFYGKISEDSENIIVKYMPAIENINHYSDFIAAGREQEIKEASTIFGPHRDNLEFLINGRNVNTSASRGEIRSVIFALKMSELEYIKSKKANPLLLLDDIFSELDSRRREELSRVILDYPAVITTTDVNFLGKELKEKAKIIHLK